MGRNTEIINAEQIGTSDTAPMAFFDEGLWLGNYQAWTGSGVHLKEPGVNGLPVYKNTLGAAVQFAAGGLFAEFGFDYFRGEVGERQNVWYRFRGPEYSMKLDYRFGKNTLRGYVLYEYGTNRKSVLDKVTSGGVTLVKEYGSNKIRETGILNVGVSYEWTNDAMVFGAGVSFLDRRDVVSVRYPFVSGRELMSGDVRAYATLPFGKWEIGVRLDLWQGGPMIPSGPFRRLIRMWRLLSGTGNCIPWQVNTRRFHALMPGLGLLDIFARACLPLSAGL